MSIEFLSDLCVCEIPFVNIYDAYKTDYPMKNSGRYHCGMLYTVEGSEIYSFEDSTVRTQPDSVLIIPKNEQYSIRLHGERSLVITVDFEIPESLNFRPFIVKLEKNNTVIGLFSDIEKKWRKNSAESSALTKSYFYKAVSLLIRRMGSYRGSNVTDKVYTATEQLHRSCLDRSFRIDNLAKMCGMSRRYFEKLFFDVHNVSPKEYITSYKLTLAKEMLLSEKNTVTDIAHKLGYSDVYHFSKVFKAKTGYTPTEYKSRNRSNR